jgi:cytochrome c6
MKVRAYLIAAAMLAVGGGQPVTLAAEASQFEQGRVLFQQGAVPPCGLCHALKAAGTEGAIGPALDELKPDPDRVARALRNGIGQMPSYQGSLSESQIQAIAAYVAKASSGR